MLPRHRGAVAFATAATGLLVACQGASFSELSSSPTGGRAARHGAGHHDLAAGSQIEVKNRPGEEPRLVLPELEHDFGEVAQGEKVSHVFKVRNEGRGVLHIKNVRGS